MSQYILAVDQGTTGTTVALVDSGGLILKKVNHEYPQIYPKPGWVEHNLDDIWGSVLKGIDELFKLTGINPNHIAAIGITNQRETVGFWDRRTGAALAHAIVWQCRRTSDRCQKLKKNKSKVKKIYDKTGLVIDPYFSATKLEWLLDEVSGLKAKAKSGHAIAGTMDTFLIWKLTGGQAHVSDVSNASRTMLMNINTGKWDGDLLKEFHVPANVLAEIVPSSGVYGVTKGIPGLPDGIPIAGVAGDQQAALFGQTCFRAGEAKCTFGTGSFLLMNTGTKRVKSKSQLLTTVAWKLKNDKQMTYALEGGAFICGAAVQWLRDGLGLIEKSSDVEQLALRVPDSGGVEFVPALTGLGAPHWDPEARGLICGITRGTTKAHFARATLEAMALQNVDILEAMQKDLGKKLLHLKVDGGATANNLLMQIQADYVGRKLVRPQQIETTVAGAAYLAGLGVDYWSSTRDIEKVWKADQEFKASISEKQRKGRLQKWHEAIERTK